MRLIKQINLNIIISTKNIIQLFKLSCNLHHIKGIFTIVKLKFSLSGYSFVNFVFTALCKIRTSKAEVKSFNRRAVDNFRSEFLMG